MSVKKCEIRPKFLIGERVLWLGSGSGLPKSGQVRWIGRLLEIGPNLAVGLELDEPLPYGGIDGTWGTRRLFSCESKHGLIVPSSSVIPQPQHRGSLPSEKKDKNSTLTTQLINKAQDTEERSPVAPRRRHAPKTLPRQIKLFERTPQTDKNGQTFRRMNREFRISEEHLETSSSISSRSCGSKRDRTSGIFSFFKWFKKDSRSFDSDDFDSPPLPGSPILKRGNGPVGSVDTLFSTATTNSFAFIPPSYYRPFGSANQPEIRIALGPETNTYKNRIKHLRKFEQNISLIEKYKLYESGTLPRSVDRINEIREYPKSESESKNSSIKRKKRKAPPPPLTLSENCLPEAQNKENLWKHRRALSEPEATTLKIHVKGKRKAPQPPVFKDGTLSLTRKKRPAPPPPKIDEISKIIKDASFDIIKSDTASNTAEIEVLSTDTLKLERGVLKPNKSTMAEPKYSPSSPVSPRPWYKRNTPKDTVIWKLDKKKPREYNDTFLESGFPRKYNSGEKFVNIFSKVDKPEDKRKSQISILTNISELDREAAEIVKKNKEKEQEALAAVNKSFYPQAELDQMVHRVVLDEAVIRVVDNQIAKIEELDEYDRNTKSQTVDAKPPVIQEASESSAKSTCSSASSSTYESTTSKPEIKYNGGLVWVCTRCTLENCRWKITCAACDAWRPSPCEFREKTKNEEKTEKTFNTEFLDKTSQLVENISKGLNMSKMMEKDQGSLNQIDKQAEEVRLARLAFFDKQKNVESSESEIDKQQISEKPKTVQSSENVLFEKPNNNLESTNNQKKNMFSSELTNDEKRKNTALESTSHESEKNESEPEKVNNLTLNYKKDIEKEKDVAKSIEECRQILQNIRVTQQKHKEADASKVVNTEEKVEKISESISDYSKITNCINAFPTKEVNKNDFAVPGTSAAAMPGTSKVTNGGAIPKVKEIQKDFKKPLPPLKITEESLKMEKDKTEIKETSVQTTQVDKPKNVSQDIEESRRMLKEMLKEMKHSLPKRPESKKVKDEKPFQHSNDVAEAYLIESETIIEEIKLKKPSEKVSSSAQTSAMVRQIVPKVKPPSGAQIIVPMTVEEHQIKDGVLYTSVSKQAKKIGTATFELLRPRDFANIEAVKKNKAVPPLYVNVEPDELKTLSEQLTQPQGIANFKAELDDASAMNTMAVNRLLKRLESAIANGQLELAAVLAKELAQMKVNCSVTRQKPGPVSKHIVVELYIEDKHNHRGPFPLRVSPKMTLADLKKQVEVEYDLPCDVQRWILGKNLANDDSATLESMGVDAPKTPIFLYLVVPEGKVQEVEEAIEKEEKAKEVNIKINLEVKENQIPVVRDIPIQIVNEPSDDEEDNEGIEEISNPEIEIVEPVTPLQDEAKQFPFGTLALGWKCKQCTLINRPTRVDCAACGIQKPSEYKVPVEYQVTEDEKKENYQKLMDLEKDDLIVPLEEFECPICLVRYESNDGVILRECLHVFCRGCLANTVEYSEEAEVKCPYRDDIYTCDSTLLEREIKSLVTPQIYEGHLAKSIALAETKIGNTFHCKTPDCKGWCIYEDNVNLFKCPVCTHTNCLTCQAVHEGLNCKQYQEQVNLDSETNVDSKRTKEMLQEMVDRGEAMNCPTCQVVLMKKWGCDWLRCSMCKTEICWITRGPRWGPNGKGDTTGGCQCGVNGIKCHPKCTYCH